MHTRTGRAAAILTSTALVLTGLVAGPAATADDAAAPVATHPVTWTGESTGSFGSSLSRTSCDVTDDGIDDLIVGDQNWRNASNTRVGAAYVIVGGTGIVGGDLSDPPAAGAIRIDGIQDWSGWSVSCVGDVNKDGVEDFALGSGSRTFHKVAVVFGSKKLSDLRIDNLGDRGFIVEDPLANDQTAGNTTDNFGYWVGPAGDFDGDGYADIAIGDLLADNNGLDNSGSVWVVGGAAGSADVDVQADTGRVLTRIDGQNAQDRLATAEAAGDVNGDTKGDLVVGSYVAVPWGSTSPAAGAGYVVFGGSTERLKLSGDLGDRGFIIAGPQRARDRLGISAATLGDLNGDGLADVIVGGDGVTNAATGPRNGGAAVVFGAASSAPVITAPDADPSVYSCADGALDAECTGSTKISRGYYIDGEEANAGAGASVAGLGDVNGDGVPDIGIGADGTERAHVVYGEPARTATLRLAELAADQGESYDGAYWGAVGEAGDVDGNGVRDIAYTGNRTATVLLRGALNTGLVLEGAESASAGDAVELTATASALVPSAQEGLAGTLRISANDETLSESQEIIGGDPVVFEVPAVSSGQLVVVAEFAPSDAAAYRPASAEHTIEVGLRDDGSGRLALDGRLVEAGDTVTAEFRTAQELTGDVEFRTGDRVLATAPIEDGTAEAELASLEPGKYEIVAHYSGDRVYAAFDTRGVSLRVAKIVSEIEAPRLSTTRIVYGAGAVTATVRVPGASDGTVTFTDNGRVLQKAAVGADGTATIRLAKPAAGTHDLAARFNGSDTHAAGTSSEETRLSVSKAKPTSVSVSGKRFKKGTTPRVAVRVGKLDNGSYPVGKVRVQVGSVKKTVSLSAAKKGRVTVKLTKKYRKSVSVRATFLPKDAKNVAKATSKRAKVRTK